MLCGQLPFENQFSTRWQLMRRLNFRDLIRAQRKEERIQSDLKWRDVIKFLGFFWLILMTKACLLPRKFGRQNLYGLWEHLQELDYHSPDQNLTTISSTNITTTSIASVTSTATGIPRTIAFILSLPAPHHQQPYHPTTFTSAHEQAAASSLCLNEGSVSLPSL